MNARRAADVPLAGPLAALLPDARQTQLLRAALYPPDPAGEALEAWLAGVAGARSPTHELAAGAPSGQLLAPLIAHNLAGAGRSALPERLWTYFRAALVREQLRASTVRAICAEALAALRESGVVAVVLRGVAASETVYPQPTLRHCHDLDLFVAREAVDAAGQALVAAGFLPPPALVSADGTQRYTHRSGMPAALHTDLFHAPWYRRRPETLGTRARPVAFLGAPAHLLAPTDQVAHLLIHAAGTYSRATLRWACDAWLTIRANPGLDWERLAEEITARWAALPATILLSYLAHRLAAPIPESVLATVRDAAARATRVDKEVALWGVWAAPGARLDWALRRAAGASERAFLLRWRLAPGPDALAAAGRVGPGRGRLRFYLGRPWRLLARGLGRLSGATRTNLSGS